jgi:transcriptional regulator with XRE-family HTH domain
MGKKSNDDKQLATISRIFKLLRTTEGLSEGELAGHLGISLSYVSALETGKREPTLRALNAYARHFGIRAADLLYIAEDTMSATNAELVVKVFERKMEAEKSRRQKALASKATGSDIEKPSVTAAKPDSVGKQRVSTQKKAKKPVPLSQRVTVSA